MNKKRAILFDRDGTINPDPGYISNPDEFTLFPEVPRQLARLKQAGYLLVLVTNQSGIGRGLIQPKNLCLIHQKMQNQLLEWHAEFDRILVCPHLPAPVNTPPCDCRKPAPGLALRAIRELDLDPAACFVIGDRESDVKMAMGAGIPAILISQKGAPEGLVCTIVSSFDDAVERVLGGCT